MSCTSVYLSSSSVFSNKSPTEHPRMLLSLSSVSKWIDLVWLVMSLLYAVYVISSRLKSQYLVCCCSSNISSTLSRTKARHLLKFWFIIYEKCFLKNYAIVYILYSVDKMQNTKKTKFINRKRGKEKNEM